MLFVRVHAFARLVPDTRDATSVTVEKARQYAICSFQETHELLDSNRELVFATLHIQQDEMADATGVTTGQARTMLAAVALGVTAK